jgi:hypothetical protein
MIGTLATLGITVVASRDIQPLHLRLQGCTFQTQSLRGAVTPGKLALGLS